MTPSSTPDAAPSPAHRLRTALPTWLHVSDLQGLAQLGTQATLGVTGVAEAVQGSVYKTVAAPWGPLGARFVDTTPGATGIRPRGITSFVYGSVKAVTRLAGGSANAVLARVGPLLGERRSAPPREAMLSALNGVLGDHLQDTANPLALTMELRQDGEALTLTTAALAARFPQAGGKLLLMAHGLCMNDLQWRSLGAALPLGQGHAAAHDLGYTALDLRYNTGLPIAENGRQLAALLEHLCKVWPQAVTDIAIVTHSMGGLVARSACHHGEVAGHAWRQQLKKLVFLSTPHQGAPLETLGGWVDTLLDASVVTRPFARIGRLRSAGINDLRDGRVLHGEGAPDLPPALPLPEGVACYAVAGVTTAEPGPGQATSMKNMMAHELVGDGLVPVPSALGEHSDPARRLDFDPSRRLIVWQTHHIGLLASPVVAQQLRSWLAE